MAKERILVIKHGALGDILLATGPMAAIRRHHAEAHIVLLTTRPYVALLEKSPYFDEIWVDERPKLWQLTAMARLVKRLNGGNFARVYDLQTSQRSAFYFKLFGRKPLWSGISPGAAFRHDTPHRTRSHTFDRQREQLAIAGITDVPPPSIDWLKADVSRFGLAVPYVLLVPGGSAHRLMKRWPAEHYAELAKALMAQGMTPVLIGAAAEKALLDGLAAKVPQAINLCGQTDIAEIAALGRGAALAIGNDTGPLHLLAIAGAPCIGLYSSVSDPALCRPWGEHSTVLRRDSLAELPVEEVLACISARLRLDTLHESAFTAGS